MKKVKKILAIWLIMMFLVTFNCMLVYIITQQSLRLGANELPVQAAIDISIRLQNGQKPENIIPSDKTDITRSLNTFVMIFDNNKNLIVSSGEINGGNPVYPAGVLDNVNINNESRVTWQPETGLRFASVAIKYENGFIVAARSLTEIEKLVFRLGRLTCIAWLSCFVFITVVLAIIYIFKRKPENEK